MKKKIIYLCVFVGLGFILLQIPFTNIIGSDQKFSIFDFFAPTIGMLLTSVWGAISVIIVKLINALVNGQSLDTATIIRFFPLALAALYFGARRYKYVVALIPLICMMLFIIHPEGRGAWYYSLYWLIPVVAVFNKKSLVMNSLGATFTAHSIGSVAFLYAFSLPTGLWISLIPIVFLERMLFTAGIATSYVLINSVVNQIVKYIDSKSLKKLVNQDYVISRRLLQNL